MTTAQHARRGIVRREHVVAASLVGAVVVVVGFASGLGTHRTTENHNPAAPRTEAAAQPPLTTAPSTPDQIPANPGANPPQRAVAPRPQPQPLPPSQPHTSTPPPSSTTSPPPTTPPPSTTTPPPQTDPPCQPGLLGDLPILPGALPVVGGLPILGGLVGGLVGPVLAQCP